MGDILTGVTPALDDPGNSGELHSRGLVPESAWAADALARQRGRVAMFNACRPGGLDTWTMELRQYELMRAHILDMLAGAADEDGTLLLKTVVDAAQARYGTHELFPKGRLHNYCTFTKVDLEARGLIERVPGKSPQRLRLIPLGAEQR